MTTMVKKTRTNFHRAKDILEFSILMTFPFLLPFITMYFASSMRLF